MKHLTKKLLVTIAIIFSFLSLTTVFTSPTHAREVIGDDPSEAVVVPPTGSTTTTNSSGLGSCRPFLGMTSWDCGINPDPQGEDELKENIWTIAANIFVDIGIIATYLAIGYIIYGGYLYMTSSGDVSKAMTGKKTLTRAFIGLAIVMLANIILNTIRIVLLGNNSSIQSCNPAVSACANPGDLVKSLIDWFIGIAGIVATVFVVIGGVGYMTSQGDPGKLQKAKTTILYALIGLIIVALSRLIITFVYNALNENSDFEDYGTSLIIQKTVDITKSSNS